MADQNPAPVDITRPLRGVDALERLVAYVFHSDPKNETDWLEWKCGLDLKAKEARFQAAKHVLGFANRSPDSARYHGVGLAYLVLGVEPGNAPGQPPMDPADLVAAFRPYVGSQGPSWTPLWVPFRAVQALVVTVEAPRWGDPIHTLQQALDGFEAGAIFIRHAGRTNRASPDDVRMLTDRTTRVQPLDMVVSSLQQPLCALDTGPQQVEAWLAEERERLLAPLRSEKMERLRDGQRQRLDGLFPANRFVVEAAAAAIARATEVLSGRRLEEDRAEEGYLRQVGDYVNEARPLVVPLAIKAFLQDPSCHFALTVENPTERNIPDVRVELTFGTEAEPGPDEGEEVCLPARPRPWGPRYEGGLNESALAAMALSRVTLPIPTHLFRGLVPQPAETEVRGRTVAYWVGHLRPLERFVAKPILLLVAPSTQDEVVARWTATSKGMDGILRGEIRLPLDAPRPLEVYLPHPDD